MKRLILITLAITLLIACGDTTVTPRATLPDQPAPEPGDPPVPYSMLVYDSDGAGFSNGTTYSHFINGIITPVAPSMFTVNDVLYNVDLFGAVVSTIQLPAMPSAVTLSGPDIWTLETVPAAYAAANGGLNREYTRVWRNYIEQDAWLDRQWTATHAVSTLSGDIVATDTLGRLYTITGPETPHYAAQDGIFVHSVDAVNRTGRIMTDTGNHNIAWSTNYFNGADEWLELEGTWYSWNGYRWNAADGLTELDTAMATFINWTRPVIIEAGTRMDAALERGYWIEANTGWLWEYTPAMDRLETAVRLYVADGARNPGVAYAAVMDPQIVQDELYYTFEGQVWRYDFGSGINGPFVASKSIRAL